MEEALTVGVKSGNSGEPFESGKDEDGDTPQSRRSLKWLIGIGVASVLLLVGLIVAVSVALTSGNNSSSDASASNPGSGNTGGTGGGNLAPGETLPPLEGGDMGPDPDTTLGRIYNEGILRCGVPVEQPGFAKINTDTDRMEGFDADLCRAVAAGIFGPDNLEYRIEFMPVTAFDRFQDLHDGTFDVLARTTTHTMEREVLERSWI
ncbi:MAG: hypothetical protein SGARI_007597 [Bacillariaceae sp.]